ncbi:MAG: trypsin-like peptidase domain-containing protein [Acidobacteriia bacterium]|nr:trypsin-like peptidase domain-containing protein [Terriglobia bacterium]
MKSVFVHLSGSHRGDTQEFEKENILIGCDPKCDVCFKAGADDKTSDLHAEIYFDNCEYYLRDLGSSRGTFVNDHEIDEIILKEGDVLEFGEGGPKVRFHVEMAKGEVCKPFHVVYRDSVRKSRRFRRRGIGSTTRFFGEFTRGLLRHSTPRTRMIFIGAIILVGISVTLSALVLIQGALSKRKIEREIIQLQKQLAVDQRSRQALERDILEERRRGGELRAQHESETEVRLAGLQVEEQKLREQLTQAQNDASLKAGELQALRAKLNETTRHIDSVNRERSLGERVIKKYQYGVCYIEGAIHFYDASGNPLRFLALDSAGEPIKDSQGQTLYTTSGTAPMVEVYYSGTGFLVSGSGLILTNRHVAEPWWEDREMKDLTGRGFRPRLQFFRAYFPTVVDPFKLDVVKTSTLADVALVKADLGSNKLPVLEVERQGAVTAAGQPVVLLGYPTGLNALLARLDEKVVESVVSTAGPDPKKISQELSRRGMIRPLSTQGHLSDILPNKLVYDAQTTQGGSGGPLFNARGKVIGVNYAILSEFGGANFGVPIQFGLELMK